MPRARGRGAPALLGLLAACGPAPASIAAQAAAPAAETAAVVTGEHVSAHGSRRYRLVVPPRHDGTVPAPLVVLLHGCGQGPEDLARAARLETQAAEAGALVLYPEQPAAANPLRCWNWFLPAHQGRDAGEPALIAGMTRDVAAAHGADPRRIYVAGLSAGGAMAVLTALAYPELYAAVGSHSGTAWRAATDLPGAVAAMRGAAGDPVAEAAAARRAMGERARFVPLIALHGTADTIVQPAAQRRLVAQFAALHEEVRATPLAVVDSTRSTCGGLGCTVRRFRAAATAAPMIEEWTIAGLGHALAGGTGRERFSEPRGPDALREMLRFFLEHPLEHSRSD